jgi:hypothetical protein
MNSGSKLLELKAIRQLKNTIRKKTPIDKVPTNTLLREILRRSRQKED